ACTQPVSLASAETLRHLLAYLAFRRGPLTSNIGEVGGFVKTRPDRPAPDVEVIFAPVYFLGHGFTNPKGHGFTIGPLLLHPESQGTIRLRTDNPFDMPAIQPSYLATAADARVLVEGVKLCRRLAHTHAFEIFRGEEVTPGAQAQSDRAIEEQVRAL